MLGYLPPSSESLSTKELYGQIKYSPATKSSPAIFALRVTPKEMFAPAESPAITTLPFGTPNKQIETRNIVKMNKRSDIMLEIFWQLADVPELIAPPSETHLATM
jgi:hypothetical protein